MSVLVWVVFFAVCHPYNIVHFVQMFFVTCVYRIKTRGEGICVAVHAEVHGNELYTPFERGGVPGRTLGGPPSDSPSGWNPVKKKSILIIAQRYQISPKKRGRVTG